MSTTHLSTLFSNPAIPVAQPNLSIEGKIVCCTMMQILYLMLSAPNYGNYLKKKLKWTHGDLTLVHWEVLHLSLQSFNQHDQCQLILFINDKLPLHTSKAHPHTGSPLCPSCQPDNEDPWHFLECQQQEHKALFSNLKTKLTTTTQKLGLHPCILTSL